MTLRAAVLTVSDRSAAGERADACGPRAVEMLRAAGWSCPDAEVIPDGSWNVAAALVAILATGVRLIVTTGGTGLSPRDETPEGALRVIHRELPGMAEEIRRRGLAQTPMAMLSRGVAGVHGGTLIVTLPGSLRAVESGMEVVLAVAGHALSQLDGGDH